ncbi:hypothetical protein EAJ79_23300 [Salmonella enterica]|nr:hypothetical protein [Salmonella enterica]EAS8534605.1 hypothetical protein [Salmonella enterica]EBW5029010.1 hypothetical protein [Salmonella enterica subsp. enterica serovar Enteritidis]ECC9077140.1 hypothetical protein [Salmonella enterica subsp. enterica]
MLLLLQQNTGRVAVPAEPFTSEGLIMSELAGLHLQINELDEYEQYLLSALLKKAAADAGKKLNMQERRAVAAEFFASRQDDRKNKASNQRRALMSRKMREIRAQEKSDFHWKPARPRR